MGMLQVAVRDTGIGIAPEALTRLFQPFMQADGSTTRQYGGTGLGLAITKQLVALMGGELTVESVAGAGSTFTFRIPVDSTEPPATMESRSVPAGGIGARTGTDSASPGRHAGAQRTILIAEDNPVNQKLALMQVRSLGYAASVVDNGEAAVMAAASGQYALVLMDCQMPLLDGFAATRAIRQTVSQDLPVIAMTASAMQGDQEACLAAGMNDYLAKPIRLDDLGRVIGRWLPPSDAVRRTP
jgi:CheY-like chemotaxis protein